MINPGRVLTRNFVDSPEAVQVLVIGHTRELAPGPYGRHGQFIGFSIKNGIGPARKTIKHFSAAGHHNANKHKQT